MRTANTIGVLRETLGALFLAGLLGVATERASACTKCTQDGTPGPCSVAASVLYGDTGCPTSHVKPAGDDSWKYEGEGYTWEGPNARIGGGYWVRLTWGKETDTGGRTVDFTVCFEKPSGEEDGTYNSTKPGVVAKAEVADGDIRLLGANGEQEKHSSVILERADGTKIFTKTLSGGNLASEQRGADLFSYTYESGRLKLVTQERGVDPNEVVVKKTYFRYMDQGEILVRKRITVEEYNSDGTKRFLTSIYAYYDSGDNVGRLKFVVRPEGVKRYLTSNGATTLAHGIDSDHPENECDLDRVSEENSVPDESLDDYAEAVYTAYDDQDRVTEMTSYGGGCCGGGGEAGQYKFAYGPSSERTPVDSNDWKTWRRITAPSGLQTVEFYNADDQMIFQVVQQMNANKTINQVWITHYKYYLSADGSYRQGQLKEHRYPSACTGYTYNTENDASGYAWVKDFDDGGTHNGKVNDSGTTGLVRLYDYHDPSGKIAWEKVRQGTSSGQSAYYVRKVTYTSHTYGSGNPTVYLVDNDTTYPTAQTSEVPNPDDRQITDHDYTFYADSNAVEFETVKHHTVSTANNGSNSQTQVEYHYERDTNENLYYNDWTKHEDNSYSYTELGIGFWNYGQVVKTVEDVDDDAGLTPPGDWDPPLSGRLNLTTEYAYYGDDTGYDLGSLSRLRHVEAPGGQKTAYAYECQRKTVSSKETTTSLVTLVAPHMDGDDDYDYAPVQITVADLTGRTICSAAGDATTDEDGNLANDWDATDEAIADAFVGTLCARTDSTYNVQGQLTSTDRYYDIANSKKLTASHEYDATTGLRTKTTAPEGTIAYTVYDQQGRTTAAWMGTDATGATQTNPAGSGSNNMKKITETYYDQATPGSGSSSVGDGNVTQSKTYYDDNNAYDTVFNHDYRNRLERSRGPDNVATVRTLDNFGRDKETKTYANATLSSGVITVTNANLRAKSETAFDQKGQVYQTIVHEVDADDGDVHDALTTNYWYDLRGQLIKTKDPNGLFTKTAYDGVGRTVASYLSYDDDDTEGGSAYSGAGNVTGDTVVEQTKYAYDATSNVWLTRSFQRHTGATGTGELNDPGGSQPKARVTYAVAWFDKLGRTTKTVFYGDNGNAVIDDVNDDFNSGESGTPAYSAGGPAVNSSDLYIVSTSTFSASTGRLTDTYDNKGIKTAFTYDCLGRTTKTIENFTGDGSITETTAGDVNRTTEYVFDVKGRLAYLNARNPKGTGNGVQDQKTYYVYGDSVSAARPTKIVYPDTQDTVSGDNANDGYIISVGQNDTDHVAITYDRLGRKVTSTDQRDVVHAYAYDSAGRLSSDDADTQADPLPAGVDNAVVKLGRAYDDVGRLQTITSYNSSDTVVNETKVAFDAWGNVAESVQDHAGAAGSGDPAVTYTYQDGAASGEAKYVRLEKITYPGASREVYYRYGTAGGTSDVLSRLDNLADSSGGTTVYAQYTYLGAGTIAKVAHPAVSGGLNLAYDPDGDDSFDGLDRFGRVVDQRWQNSTPTVKDQFKYGYDRASNRTWRDVGPDMASPPSGKDEFYLYDGLDRLIKANRGNLAGSPPTITDANAAFSQAWAAYVDSAWQSRLEALGNWPVFKQDDNGGGSGDSGWELSQTRLHNKVNEIDNDDNHANAPSGSISGGSWVLPVYDAAGNTTAGPRPGSEHHRCWYIWDAWNRLVAVWVDDGDGTMEITGEDPQDILIATYRYDGLNRRIRKLLGTNPAAPNTAYDYYYNESWQIVEVRKDSDTDPFEQYVWDARYIDAPVVRFRDGNTDGDLTGGTQEGDNTLYYTNDANMNVTALVDGYDGAVVERYMYDPYGKPTVLHGVRDSTGTAATEWNTRSSNTFQNHILYCGYYFDDESGLYSVRHSYYHPTLGRRTSRELKVYLDGMNLYQYTRSSPIDLVDPSGLNSIESSPLESTEPSPSLSQKTGNKGDALPRLSPIVEGTDEEVCAWANVRFDRENPDVVRCGCKVTRDEEAKPYRVAWRPLGEWQEEEIPIENQQKMGEKGVQGGFRGWGAKSWWRLNQIVWQEAKKGAATILYQGTFALVMRMLGATNYLSDEEYTFFFEAKDPYDDYETQKITDYYNGQHYADPNRSGPDPRCDPLDNNWIRDRY
jgi:RHS repeat-associated protein